jgi:hypothetical protein
LFLEEDAVARVFEEGAFGLSVAFFRIALPGRI